jgi:two-component system phosphate regulon response regulator PhoB
MAARVLLVDDDRELASTLEYNLTAAGYQVESCASAAAACRALAAGPLPDLVLLDLILPDTPGLELCRRLRASPRTARLPIVILSALSEEVDRVVGLELGADDYVTKPFSVRELLLRIRALLTRLGRPPVATPEAGEVLGSLRLDRAGHRVWAAGASVCLTALELRLFCLLVDRRGQVIGRAEILEALWGGLDRVKPRIVDTHVMRLRRKLGPAGACIETLRGRGYRFTVGPEEPG